MKAIVFTKNALFHLSQFSITKEWFKGFDLPENIENIKRVNIDEVLYIMDANAEDDHQPLIIVNNYGQHRCFRGNDDLNTNILERIITVARSIYTHSVSIPESWRAYHADSLLSIMASPGKNQKVRLHFDSYPQKNHDLFVFARTDMAIEFNRLTRHEEVYQLAREKFTDAILAPHQPANTPIPKNSRGITLSQRLPQGFVQGATLEEWYKSKLTKDQLSFVDKPYDGPVRLKGVAGTGKTLSLVIKFIKDAVSFKKENKPFKMGFITHSGASVDLVSSIGESLDSEGILYGDDKSYQLEIKTLYTLAHEHLRFDLDELIPLSLDGQEGRQLQYELIQSVLIEMCKSEIVRMQYEDLTHSIKESWYGTEKSGGKKFIFEIMNEFASVLDGEGIRAGEEKGVSYIKGSKSARQSWLMPLPTEIDRKFILEVHRRYRKLLGEMKALSVDQMIVDFNSFLDSNRWDRVRERIGYDAIFVDELHLFTSIERKTLHKLIKTATSDDGTPKRPPIFMAYDIKQSPSDSFIEYGDCKTNLFVASNKLQNAELVKLVKVFRYTPQIVDFLSDLDASFPTILQEDWEEYGGEASLNNGPSPMLVTYKEDANLIEQVFLHAEKAAKNIVGGGRRVAVLCVSEEKFNEHIIDFASKNQRPFLAITNREELANLRHLRKKFVFSRPEYVAGLQFDTVFLIYVDAEEAPQKASDGVRRRFVSNVYLGASRAERLLKIAVSATRGGASDILKMALERKSLLEVSNLDP